MSIPDFQSELMNVRIDVPCAGKSSKPSKPANYARRFEHDLLVDPLPHQIHVEPSESNMRYWMWEVKNHLNNPQELKLHMQVGFYQHAKKTSSLHPKSPFTLLTHMSSAELLVESGVGLNHPKTA